MDARRKRINRLKKIILGTIAAMILIPLTGCIWLSVELYQKNVHIRDLQMLLQEQELSASQADYEKVPEMEELSLDAENKTGEELPIADESGFTSAEDAEPESVDDKTRKVYLTFDDGPSSNTNQILDILAEHNVKATFFVVGKPEEYNAELYQRIVAEGHSLGMHSYSHKYQEVYQSLPAFRSDLEQLRDYLYDITGENCVLYRFPGGSSNNVCTKEEMQEYIQYLNAMGIVYFDWNISSGDAASGGSTKSQIVQRVMSQIGEYNTAVVLMHDSTDKRSTVEALPEILDQLESMDNLEILPITESTIPVQHKTN